MGQICLILGPSGTGKSASLRNLKKEECLIFNTANKLMPFKSELTCINLRDQNSSTRYETIKSYIQTLSVNDKRCKMYVVDDAQFLMAFELMSRANEKGYDKFTEIARHWSDLMEYISGYTPDDVIVYFLMHNEYDNTNGTYKAKTVGKMVEQYMSPESLATIVLGTKCTEGKYTFTTHNSGSDTCKSPIGMFNDDEIDNDLKLVDSTIRDYYGFDKLDKKVSK